MWIEAGRGRPKLGEKEIKEGKTESQNNFGKMSGNIKPAGSKSGSDISE